MCRRLIRTFATILPALFWLMQPIVAQNITRVKVESVTCTSVNISARIDPVSTTYIFAWVVSTSNIDIVLVGLDGEGNVRTADLNSGFNYSVENIPNFLPNKNDEFESILTFNFGYNQTNTDLVFKTISTPLVERINDPVSKPRCPMTVRNLPVFCIDNSQDCFFCGSNVFAFITCPNNTTLNAICNENQTFTFDNCLTDVVSSIPTDTMTLESMPISSITITHVSTDIVIATISQVTYAESQQSTTTDVLTQSTTEQRPDVSSKVTSDMTTNETTPITIEDSTVSTTDVTRTILAITSAESQQSTSTDLLTQSTTEQRPAVLSTVASDMTTAEILQTISIPNKDSTVSTDEVTTTMLAVTTADNNQLNICPGISIPNLRYQCNRQVCYLSCDRGTVLVGPRITSCSYLRRSSSYYKRCKIMFSYKFGKRG